MPRIIGTSQTVVEIDGLRIDELAGNVATSEDTISIAYVTITEPTSEPWLTLDYDEWICVRTGKMVLQFEKEGEADMSTMDVNAGETCFIAKGERFRPVFPIAPTEYIPVCTPAFRPDRCHREEGDVASDVTNKLLLLHGMDGDVNAASVKIETVEDNDDDDVLYHMCLKDRWEEAVKSQAAYYPPTFEQDGYFTHATSVPQRLIDTANHFYQSSTLEMDWICVQLSRLALTKVGISTRDEEGMPVGDTPVADMIVKNDWKCPHIYGGIPTLESLGIVTQTFPMTRSEQGEFLNVTGLTDVVER